MLQRKIKDNKTQMRKTRNEKCNPNQDEKCETKYYFSWFLPEALATLLYCPIKVSVLFVAHISEMEFYRDTLPIP